MSIHELHVVLEALGDTVNHVLDVGAGSLDDRQLLGGSEPLLHLPTSLSDTISACHMHDVA